MKLFLSLIFALFYSQAVFAAFGEFTNEDLIPPDSQIYSVETVLIDIAKRGYRNECNDSQCFRLNIYINGDHVAQWMVSPGRPHSGSSFRGNYTPAYSNGTPYSTWRIYRSGYVSSRGDSMPWAAFWERNDGGHTVIATHCGHVTGRRESHGCVRMVCSGARNDAKRLNLWVRAAQANGGEAISYTFDTRP